MLMCSKVKSEIPRTATALSTEDLRHDSSSPSTGIQHFFVFCFLLLCLLHLQFYETLNFVLSLWIASFYIPSNLFSLLVEIIFSLISCLLLFLFTSKSSNYFTYRFIPYDLLDHLRTIKPCWIDLSQKAIKVFSIPVVIDSWYLLRPVLC